MGTPSTVIHLWLSIAVLWQKDDVSTSNRSQFYVAPSMISHELRRKGSQLRLAGWGLQKTAILAELEYSAMRLLGYNGPAVPDDKKTWELQAMLK